MAYAYPTNMTSFTSYQGWMNSVTNNFYGTGVLIAIFMIVFLTLITSKRDKSEAMGVASFVATLSALFMYGFGIVSLAHVVFVIVLLGGSVAWMYSEHRKA